VAWGLSFSGTKLSEDSANNRTRYTWAISLTWNNADRYSGYSTTLYYYIGNVSETVAGPSSGGTGSTSGSTVIKSGTDWFTHNNNGELALNAGATLNGPGSPAPGSLEGYWSATDEPNYDRRPYTPSFQSIQRSGQSLNVYINATTSPAGTATYTVTRSENGGAFGDSRSSTGRVQGYSGLSLGSTQQFRVFASNSDGSSGTATSSTVSIPNIPTAPTISTTAPSGRALNVSCGVSEANGATVTGYFVQLSPDDGATWETAISMPSRAYRFEDLAGGTNVKFRVYSQNEMGFSAFTVTDSIFIPSGGRRLTAEGFISTQTFTRLTESGPVPVGIAKRLTASGWVELS
jgi:hypothetical protein